jgi:cyclase
LPHFIQESQAMIDNISGHIYIETGVRGCNHGFVVTGEGVVMIDTPYFFSNAVKWRDEIARHGSVSYIINTEPHIDHFAGNTFFEGTVVAHEGTRKMILETPSLEYLEVLASEEPQSLPSIGDYRFRLPVITFTDKMTLYIGGRTFQLMNFPGHTPYQAAVYLPEEKVLFTSDNVVHNRIPFITPQAHIFKWLESLKQMQKLDAGYIIPGHGGIRDKSCLEEMIAELQAWLDAVADAIKQGMSLEETRRSVNLLGRYKQAAMAADVIQRTHDMNVITVYRALRKKLKSQG